MTAFVLIVEDEEDFITEIQRVLSDISSTCEVRVAKSRDSALDLLSNNFFDLIVLDLKIPTVDGSLDTDPQHGLAVFGRAQSLASGTPVFMLTGSPAEAFIPQLVQASRQVDVWGEGRDVGTISFLQKYRLEQLPAQLGSIIQAIDALADVELERGTLQLDIASDRLIRIFAKRFGGARVVVTQLGGLSAATVFRLRVTDAMGAPVHDCVAKLGPLAVVRDENHRFDTLVARLEPSATPRKLAILEVGARERAGIFYGLAAGFEQSAFDVALLAAPHSENSVGSVEAATRQWSAGVPETRRSVGDVRRRMVSDAAMAPLLHAFDLAWTTEFESRMVQTRWCCIHGDLHGENILVSGNNAAVLIDYGEVGEGPVSLDPVTLELSLFFHPDGPLHSNAGFGNWPTEDQAKNWGSVDLYLASCPAEVFVRRCRQWAATSAVGQREVAAAAYGYLMRQLKYQDTNKDLALALLSGVRTLFDGT